MTNRIAASLALLVLAGALSSGCKVVVVQADSLRSRTARPAAQAGAQFTYWYYPSAQVYYDVDRKIFFYRKGVFWGSGARLPNGVSVDEGERVQFVVATDKPYRYNARHRRKYPAAHGKGRGLRSALARAAAEGRTTPGQVPPGHGGMPPGQAKKGEVPPGHGGMPPGQAKKGQVAPGQVAKAAGAAPGRSRMRSVPSSRQNQRAKGGRAGRPQRPAAAKSGKGKPVGAGPGAVASAAGAAGGSAVARGPKAQNAGRPAKPGKAPAAGKRTYIYYPSSEVYFDPVSKTYFYHDANRWASGSNLPGGITIDVKEGVELEVEGDRPYVHHATHRAKHKPRREAVKPAPSGGPAKGESKKPGKPESEQAAAKGGPKGDAGKGKGGPKGDAGKDKGGPKNDEGKGKDGPKSDEGKGKDGLKSDEGKGKGKGRK